VATNTTVPVPNRIVPDSTAIMFFDCSRGFLRPEDPVKRAYIDSTGVVPAMQRIERVCRAAGILISYTKVDHRPDHRDIKPIVADLGKDDMRGGPFYMEWTDDPPGPWTPNPAGSPIVEVMDEIAPQPGDYVILKQRWSAFFATNFFLHLRRNEIDTLLLAGGRTEIGIASTAYAARDHDLNIVVLRDACLSPGRTDASDHLLDEVFPIFTRVMTTAEAAELIERESPGRRSA
jgi:ureidoacrylate peracid hydrolase